MHHVVRLRRGSGSAHGSAGQSLTEFALIAPIFFLLLFGVIQFGFTFGGQNALVNGVRDAARYASTYRVGDATQATAACAAVKTQLERNLQAGLPGFAVSRMERAAHPLLIKYVWYANPDGTTWSIRVEVTARYDHPLWIPLVGLIVDGIDGTRDGFMTLSASEQMRVENPALTTNGGTVTCSYP